MARFGLGLTTLVAALFASCARAQLADSSIFDANPLQQFNLSAPDGSALGTFMPFGATATSFRVKDKFGQFRDILIGYDDLERYMTERNFFGPIVGRYANRIRNGTFTIPISKDASGPGKVFHVPENEHNGTNSLHGGDFGFDRRNWTAIDYRPDQVSFALIDVNGTEGFPGTVITTVTYTLGNDSVFNMSISAVATQRTPIMLSAHQFWNLEAYQETQDLRGHVVQINSSKIIATDGNLIPNGSFIEVEGTPLDFRTATSIGDQINATAAAQYCGTGCVGFDNAWIYDTEDPSVSSPFSIWSTNSGIKLEVVTNQPALQIYSCNGIFSAADPVPRKAAQGGNATDPAASAVYENHSCVVLEQESFLDAINNPEFGVDQIYGPARPYFWHASYRFSVLEDARPTSPNGINAL
ncbi:galactose mutarotase-like domain-containing protein [Epithele typhae]|uniref:galactose mutarotase-like domain-containing protein n=1 Tax=Epithele typhae TaxID=378194 RepID=UPI002007759B|nr:galactose mutarotase-like domain-containing protein [Epithele typhae]KAH9914489.1 galactose mutarotase-like domain-containing protein [Epithele typhae]